MSTKIVNQSIILSCSEKSGIAYMLAGYLHFYKSDMKIAISEKSKLNHPIAIQVMREDGILVEQLTSNLNQVDHLQEPIISIQIEHSNDKKNTHNLNTNQSQYLFYIADPLKSTSNDELVEAFRKTREEIKKLSIKIVGSF